MTDSDAIAISYEGDVAVVTFTQASIGASAGFEQMSDSLRNFVTKDEPNKIVVDFSGVKFFSSQTLGLLLEIWRKLEKTEGKMTISGINPQLYRVFKITNLDKIFQFFDNRQDAINSLKD